MTTGAEILKVAYARSCDTLRRVLRDLYRNRGSLGSSGRPAIQLADDR